MDRGRGRREEGVERVVCGGLRVSVVVDDGCRISG